MSYDMIKTSKWTVFRDIQPNSWLLVTNIVKLIFRTVDNLANFNIIHDQGCKRDHSRPDFLSLFSAHVLLKHTQKKDKKPTQGQSLLQPCSRHPKADLLKLVHPTDGMPRHLFLIEKTIKIFVNLYLC